MPVVDGLGVRGCGTDELGRTRRAPPVGGTLARLTFGCGSPPIVVDSN